MGALGRQAVVIGGSVAGLVAARVLADRYDAVTVLDRDTLPDRPQARRGVPHGPHAHALLIRGRMALEELFPGLADELVAAGAVPFDPGRDLLFYQMGALRVRFPSGKLGVSCSRAFLEQRIHTRVAGLGNVLIRDRTAVTDLIWDGGRVVGAVVDDDERIAADLVVDATGRSGGRTDRWLASHGCPAPRSVQVKVGVGYTTRLYRRPPGDRMRDDGLLYLMAARPPHDKRAAAAFAIEGGRWIVTLGGWHGAHAPVDRSGFDKFASELPDGHIAELVGRSDPVDDDPAKKFTYPAARRRYFEELRTPPAGFAAIGDAICSFNPLYGQGMTIATLEAMALGRCLDAAGDATPAMAQAYYRAVAKELRAPWQMATGGDFMYPETSGPKAFGTDLINRYVKQVMLASHVSVPAHRLLVDMQHLLVPPSAIMRPDRIVRWLAAARRSPAR